MPLCGCSFLQMEDEIGSIAAVIGATWGGLKGCTATFGPGFSLMQENIGYAVETETPCVIINVMRGCGTFLQRLFTYRSRHAGNSRSEGARSDHAAKH